MLKLFGLVILCALLVGALREEEDCSKQSGCRNCLQFAKCGYGEFRDIVKCVELKEAASSRVILRRPSQCGRINLYFSKAAISIIQSQMDGHSPFSQTSKEAVNRNISSVVESRSEIKVAENNVGTISSSSTKSITEHVLAFHSTASPTSSSSSSTIITTEVYPTSIDYAPTASSSPSSFLNGDLKKNEAANVEITTTPSNKDIIIPTATTIVTTDLPPPSSSSSSSLIMQSTTIHPDYNQSTESGIIEQKVSEARNGTANKTANVLASLPTFTRNDDGVGFRLIEVAVFEWTPLIPFQCGNGWNLTMTRKLEISLCRSADLYQRIGLHQLPFTMLGNFYTNAAVNKKLHCDFLFYLRKSCKL